MGLVDILWNVVDISEKVVDKIPKAVDLLWNVAGIQRWGVKIDLI